MGEDPSDCLARACEGVPGLLHGALALLPEGLLLGSVGEGSAFDREPLVRSAARCLVVSRDAAGAGEPSLTFVEHVFVSDEELVVILQGKRFPRLGLALVCSLDHNLTFVVNSTRSALRLLEETLDAATWEL
jgi:hypothetical protein